MTSLHKTKKTFFSGGGDGDGWEGDKFNNASKYIFSNEFVLFVTILSFIFEGVGRNRIIILRVFFLFMFIFPNL